MFLIFLLTGCISMQTLNLNDSYGSLTSTTSAPEDKIVLFGKSKASMNFWYSCVKDVPLLSMNNSVLHAVLENSKGDCMGIYFDPMNIREYPVLKIRAQFQSSSEKTSAIDFLAGFTDSKKEKTYSPEKAKIIESGAGMKDFYFDYSEIIREKEPYIDPAQITTILIFMNIRGVEDVSGLLSVEEISLVKEEKK